MPIEENLCYKTEAIERTRFVLLENDFSTISYFRGPLWMMVNITIFGDVATMKEMLEAIE